jgi:hypothetical protein
VTPRYSGIVQGKGGCKYCAGRAVDADEAVADMLRAGLEPLQPYVRSLDPWPSRCTACGREVSPTYAAVKHQGNRCRYCATGGIDLTAPAFVYLVTHPQLGAHKVGIGMVGGPRLALHQKHGWQVYRTVNVPTGEEAYRVESEVLRWLRLDLGLPPFLTPEDMPQRGDTETVEADAVGLPTIWERVIAATAKARRQRGRMASANDTA